MDHFCSPKILPGYLQSENPSQDFGSSGAPTCTPSMVSLNQCQQKIFDL